MFVLYFFTIGIVCFFFATVNILFIEPNHITIIKFKKILKFLIA